MHSLFQMELADPGGEGFEIDLNRMMTELGQMSAL